jgi:cysteinyl-tRNA synthetase
VSDVVRIYSCGPTVYRYVHVGNLRTFGSRTSSAGPSITSATDHQVMNITDVGHLTDDSFDRGEDKMLVSAPGEVARGDRGFLRRHSWGRCQ